MPWEAPGSTRGLCSPGDAMETPRICFGRLGSSESETFWELPCWSEGVKVKYMKNRPCEETIPSL